MLEAVPAEQSAHGKIGICLRVVIRQNRIFTSHRCSRLEFESVARQMLRIQRQTLRYRVEKLRLCLVRQAVHQIKADVGEAALPCEFYDCLCLRKVVDTADAFKLGVVRRLHAKREPVDAVLMYGLQHRLIRALRIAFHRDFGVFRNCKARPDRL